MIKIIKEGKKEFIATCRTCGCQFSYELNDIHISGVSCPYCGHLVVHPEYSQSKNKDSNIVPLPYRPDNLYIDYINNCVEQDAVKTSIANVEPELKTKFEAFKESEISVTDKIGCSVMCAFP